MENYFNAEKQGDIVVIQGNSFLLDTQRIAVAPPFLMIMPFVEINPPLLEVEDQEVFPGEGVHGCTYRLRALKTGSGIITIGFRDIRDRVIVRSAEIPFIVELPRTEEPE